MNQKCVRLKLVVGVFLAFGCCLLCTQAQAGDEKFMWCKASEIGGSRIFYSDSFPGSDDKTTADYDKAFDDFVRSHYGAKTIPGCSKNYVATTNSKAKADRDSDASLERNAGKSIVFTSWTY